MSRKKKKQYQTQQTTPLCRPKVEEIAVAQVTDKYSEYPSNGTHARQAGGDLPRGRLRRCAATDGAI